MKNSSIRNTLEDFETPPKINFKLRTNFKGLSKLIKF